MSRLMSVAFTEQAVRDRRKTVTRDRLREVLAYNAETGEFTWRKDGRRAGWTEPSGYVRIGIDGSKYLASRLAWLYVHGEWPSADAEHRNGRRGDNRLANLRNLDHALNTQNLHAAHRDSASGIAGVWKSAGRWATQITINGETRWLGRFDTADEAHAAYRAAKQTVHPAWEGADA